MILMNNYANFLLKLCVSMATTDIGGGKSISIYIHHDDEIVIGDEPYDLPEYIDVDITRYEDPDNYFDGTDYDIIDADSDQDLAYVRSLIRGGKFGKNYADSVWLREEETMDQIGKYDRTKVDDTEETELKNYAFLNNVELSSDNNENDYDEDDLFDEEYMKDEILNESDDDEYDDNSDDEVASEIFNSSVWRTLGELILGKKYSDNNYIDDYDYKNHKTIDPPGSSLADNELISTVEQNLNSNGKVDRSHLEKPLFVSFRDDKIRINSKHRSSNPERLAKLKSETQITYNLKHNEGDQNNIRSNVVKNPVLSIEGVNSREHKTIELEDLRKRRQAGWDVNKMSDKSWTKSWTRPPSLEERRKNYYKKILIVREEDLKAARAKKLREITIYIGSTLSAVLFFLIFVYFLIRYPDYFICGCCVSRCFIAICCPTLGRFLDNPEKFMQEKFHEYVPGCIVHEDGRIEHYPPSEDEIAALQNVIEVIMEG